ncbi:hypothetical protein NG701_17125 [Pseudarthrobacter sp. HLT3-5]|uniref:hypothetical protein n=1 Tax=Pseudarthrobacter cellobiosi TaxID=2953654 RepID=UPI00208F0C76|nr:hypothetical protein [Pseudarthrobacter sp. HLT3-5]MCO4276125.1 hypothetical protein [Pseudarthrobacter sp. HLT3-5]
MAQKTQHVVTAHLIVAQTNTIERYFDRGAVLPEDVPAAERKRLVGLGLVAVQKVDVPDEPGQTQDQPPADPPK